MVSQSGSLCGCTNSCTVTTEGIGVSERALGNSAEASAADRELLAKHWLSPQQHLGSLLCGIPKPASGWWAYMSVWLVTVTAQWRQLHQTNWK